MYVLLLFATGVVAIVSLIIAFRRTRDPFHPLVLICPMFIALYAILPLKLLYDDDLRSFLSESNLIFAQTITLFGVFTFCAGCLVASWKKATPPTTAFQISRSLRRRILIGALVLGVIGFGAYWLGISNAGGFEAAYGRAYGGGVTDFGYIREASSLCIPAIVFILLARKGPWPTPLELLAIIIFALPSILQGVLGARRGPSFLIVSTIGLGWYMMRNRRPSVLIVLKVGLVVALLLLLLVSNRDNIFLGSDWDLENTPLEYTKAGPANEYIYGAATIIHASMTNEYYWGKRYLVVLFVRPIPIQLWPKKYEDVGIPQMEENLGTGGEALSYTVGWAGAPGASNGIVSDMWIEFWWVGLAALFVIGWLYGFSWRRAYVNGQFATVVYVIIASLSLYLVSQTLEAMLYRFLYMIIPAWLFWSLAKNVRRQKSRRLSPTATRRVIFEPDELAC
jgi:oligosaccharide repeat unit polymerase